MKSSLMNLILPEKYCSVLSVKETEYAIKLIKDFFERELANNLNLSRVSAPMFVRPETGLNDNLNGIERPVAFDVKSIQNLCLSGGGFNDGKSVEVVHSLAKWKRAALKRYGFSVDEGLYTDMNAIRRDEDTDNLHSIYVDQWDWEKIITKEQRTEALLKEVVSKIFKTFKNTESYVCAQFPVIKPILPEEIYFITTQELENRYPSLSPKEREDAITEEKKAVFIMKIGDSLASGQKHDGRAPDYDDWSLNGDIIFWYPVLNRAIELSSMGIRVDEVALMKQLKLAGCVERMTLPFHESLLKGELPYTMGGGIGQSRLCMYFLRKAHIGEVQSSIWPEDMIEACADAGINLL